MRACTHALILSVGATEKQCPYNFFSEPLTVNFLLDLHCVGLSICKERCFQHLSTMEIGISGCSADSQIDTAFLSFSLANRCTYVFATALHFYH